MKVIDFNFVVSSGQIACFSFINMGRISFFLGEFYYKRVRERRFGLFIDSVIRYCSSLTLEVSSDKNIYFTLL